MLTLPHGPVATPAFLPDATRGVLRACDAADLEACGVEALVMSTFHLIQQPGANTLGLLGGLHRFSGWQRPIVTDSGGFQVFSLIRENPKNGSLSEKGIVFRPENGRDKLLLTPEKSIQTQFRAGADVLVCLDDCTHPADPLERQREAVTRTVKWAARCRREFDMRLAAGKFEEATRPRLFAVVQGGNSPELRRECAARLLEIGFDGYGFGGWPIDDGELVLDMLALVRELIPAPLPLHALGVGHPAYIARTAALGYELFDSAMPTRDARHARLYRLDLPRLAAARAAHQPLDTGWLRMLYLQDDKQARNPDPVDPACDCLACRRYSSGYLHHLYKIGDVCFQRLATLHNLRAMVRLMQTLRA